MTVYTDRFYEEIRSGCGGSAAVVAPVVFDLVQPASVVDIGCGEGHWAKAFELLGATVVGVDGDYVKEPVIETFIPADLARSTPDVGHFDLAVSLEVAEHLPEQRADSFVKDLCNLAPTILFSAAIPQQGGWHHCFPSDTVVSGPGAIGSSSRLYQGDMVKLSFSSGEFLSVTPNHPILTVHGWVPAGLLHEGCNVIRCQDAQRIMKHIPGKYQIPSLLKDVVASVGVADGVLSRRVPCSSEDFHGDGVGSEIAIVRTNRKLRDGVDTPFSQPIRQLMFSGASVGDSLLPSGGSLAFGLPTSGHALGSGYQRIGYSLLSFGAASFGSNPIHRSSVSDGNSCCGEPTADCSSRDTQLVGDLLGVDSGLVQCDQVIKIGFSEVEQEVHNLSTIPGWYLANGIVAHNCNEQWPEYWAKKFEAEGRSVSGALRWRFWGDERVEWWYQQNLLLVTDQPVKFPSLFYPPVDPFPHPVIHPTLWSSRTTR